MLAFGQFATSSEDAQLAASTTVEAATTTDLAIVATTTDKTLATSTEAAADQSASTSPDTMLREDTATSSDNADLSVVTDLPSTNVEAVDRFALQVSDPDMIKEIIQRVVDAELRYYEMNGKYLQVMEARHLPEYESGDLTENIGVILPVNVSVNVTDVAHVRVDPLIPNNWLNPFISVA